jgi:mRNA interferase MazF
VPRIQQGSIVWAQLAPPFGRRPVLILTRDAAVGKLNALTIAPITRTIRNIPSELVLEPADGLPTVCAASMDNIFTIPRAALAAVITNLPKTRMLQIFTAIRAAFDMP